VIKANVLYPRIDGARFDLDYYVTKHIPLVKERLGDSLKSATVDRGLAGRAPGSPAPYMVMATLAFDNIGDLQASMNAHGAEFRADVPNFTDIEPTVQISETVSD
jgi:uncharacterized protein (TIGR02118 family)